MANVNAGADAAEENTGSIRFCPELEVYRYRLGSEERLFTPEELLASLVALERNGNIAQRDALALLSATAKKKPHEKIMVEGTAATGSPGKSS